MSDIESLQEKAGRHSRRPKVGGFQNAISMTFVAAVSSAPRSPFGRSRAISVMPPARPHAVRGEPYQSARFSSTS
jgi:hypothetical protein